MVDRVALEMRSTRKRTGGSNPSLSANSGAVNFFDMVDFVVVKAW